MTKVVSWNVGTNRDCLDELLAMDADVALLQEVASVPNELQQKVDIGGGWLSDPWRPRDYDRWPVVAKLSDRVDVEWFRRILLYRKRTRDEMAVSGVGTIAAARVIPEDRDPFIAVSMYARWVRPHVSTN